MYIIYGGCRNHVRNWNDSLFAAHELLICLNVIQICMFIPDKANSNLTMYVQVNRIPYEMLVSV